MSQRSRGGRLTKMQRHKRRKQSKARKYPNSSAARKLKGSKPAPSSKPVAKKAPKAPPKPTPKRETGERPQTMEEYRTLRVATHPSDQDCPYCSSYPNSPQSIKVEGELVRVVICGKCCKYSRPHGSGR